MPEHLVPGTRVTIEWGLSEVDATVVETYGPTHKRYVVVELSPELSGDVVDEPTTVTLPVGAVRESALA